MRETAFPFWSDWGIPWNLTPTTEGVSATGYTQGSYVYEHACYVSFSADVHGHIVCGTFRNRSLQSPPWPQLAAPLGTTLTGNIVASYRKIGGSRSLLVYFTTTDGGLWVYAASTGTFQQIGTGVSPSSQLAASVSQNEEVARVFVQRDVPGDVRVRMYRWYNNGWGGPFSLPATVACGNLAAAEGDIGGSIGYRVYVFCTKRDGTPDTAVRAAFTYGWQGTNFGSSWSTLVLDEGGDAPQGGYSLAATARPVGTLRTLDGFVLATNGTLYHFAFPASGSGFTGPDSLGDDGEYVAREPGIAAAPVQPGAEGYSHVLFLGPVSGLGRLYRRNGRAQPNEPAEWIAEGNGLGSLSISTSAPNTESSTAVFRDKAISVVLQTAPSDEPDTEARVVAYWSDDHGETWTEHVLPVRADDDYNADPTVAFDSNGFAWISVFGINRVGDSPNTCKQNPVDSDIYVMFTADGDNYFVNPVALESAGTYTNSNGQIVLQHDHPWIAVDQESDRLYVVWINRNQPPNPPLGGTATNHVRFASSVSGLNNPVSLNNPGNGLPISGTVPTVTVGANGAVYVGCGYGICRVDPDANPPDCVGYDAYDYPSQSPADGKLPITGTEEFISLPSPYGLVASPTDENTVYYAFQRQESGSTTRLDSFFSVLTYNPATGDFQQSTPVVLGGLGQDDGANQFSPEVTVSNDAASGDSIFVSWYDTGVQTQEYPCWFFNRCYQLARSQSWDGVNFTYTAVTPPDELGSLSDPHLLPSNCNANMAEWRFLGDYHHVTGGPLHSFEVGVAAPVGGSNKHDILRRAWVSRGMWFWVQ